MDQEPIMINGRHITDPHLLQVAQLMNKERADFVRRLRVEQDYTYRAIAQACAQEWGLDGAGNQILGMDLCAIAAGYFDEDWGKEPW